MIELDELLLIRKPGWVCRSFPTILMVALASFAGSGCSGGPAAAVPAADQPVDLSDEELAQLRKTANGVDEYRELVRTKLAERAAQQDARNRPSAGKTRPR